MPVEPHPTDRHTRPSIRLICPLGNCAWRSDPVVADKRGEYPIRSYLNHYVDAHMPQPLVVRAIS